MSAKGKEYELAIRISGIVDKSFNTALVGTNAELKGFKATINAMDKDFTKLDKGFDSIMKTGQKCFSALTTAAGVAALAIGAVTAASLAVGSEFESAFAGVKKTVEATEEEYARLRQDILDMSLVIPESAANIAAVMEIAGQLGIATDSLTDFTKTMINLGVSTNLSAEDAATALARFANVTNMANYDENGISNYERLGSVIIDLGNNFATTEEEIVMMATNLAATGDMVGLSQAEIMALATAMSAVGIKAEKGGTAMSKLLRKMQLAVETNSDSLEEWAGVANMSVNEFSDLFKNNAVEALASFINGLNDVERNGKSAVAILTDMKLGEVRLSDVILRLANAQGELTDEMIESGIAEGIFTENTNELAHSSSLMLDAIKMANEAWDENTALAIEAGKRYETFESQLNLMKNAFVNLGIAIYDNMTRTPALEWVGNITDAVNNFTKNDLNGWINRINVSVPTMGRKVRSAWKDVSPFFNGVLNFGKWLIKNGDYVLGALVGIGAALAAYKIASSIVHIVNALMAFASMNPVTLGIMGVVAAIGLLVGAIAEYKVHQQNLVDESLASHFGSIALSMADIERIASEIVHSKNLEGVKSALSAFDNADAVLDGLQQYIDELNLMNWKVSIGLELNDDEKASYQSAVENYISEMQDWVSKEGYAVQLNMLATFGENSDIASKVNAFYLESYNEMERLGKELADAVTDAFADNVLDPEEADYIAQLQKRMAEAQAAIATQDFESGLIKLQMEFGSGIALDADAFQNLQEELANQVDSVTDSYLESYARSVAAIEKTWKGGGLTKTEYEEALKSAELAYYNNMTESLSKAAAFQIQTIQDAYGEEVSSAIEDVLQTYTENGLYDWEQRPGLLFNSFQDSLWKDKDFKTTRKAIEQLLESMAPTIEQMRDVESKYQSLGQEVPKSIADALQQVDMWQGLIDLDMGDGFWKAIGQQIAEGDTTDFYNEVFASLERIEKENEEYGIEPYIAVPEGIYDGIDKAAADAAKKIQENTIRPVVAGMYAWSQEAIDEYYKNGFSVEAPLDIRINPTISGLPTYNDILRNPLSNRFPNIDHKAKGGLVTHPELTWFAENGPEMAIPMDGSSNAISLWERAGRLLGMESVLDKYQISDGGSTAEIVYSPTLQFYGEAPTKKDLEDAMEISQDKFDSMMEKYFKTHGRVSFG